MDNICFVIMPFGIGFDDLYEKVYVPAIQSQGLSPLRADEIYDNQPIIRDITQSIHHAKVILADVTGRNPNVNYELGIAHALKKEVILLTAEAKDVGALISGQPGQILQLLMDGAGDVRQDRPDKVRPLRFCGQRCTHKEPAAA